MNIEWANDIINSMIKEDPDITIGEFIAYMNELVSIEATLDKVPAIRELKKDIEEIIKDHYATKKTVS